VPMPTLVPPADRPESDAAHIAAFPPPAGPAGDHLVAIRAGHRAAFTHAAQLWQAELVAWAAWSAVAVVNHYPRPVVSSGLALPGRRAGGAGLGQPLPAGRGGSRVARKHKRWETQMSVTTFLQRATDSVTFAGGGKRRVFPQCREGADRD
jgi:hypothetical protein